jgi:hypothetical protein
VALRNGTSILFFSSQNGVTWSSQGAIFSFNPGVNEWAVRYDANRVVAFAFNGGNNIRYYRKGTLNGDGTVSWNAAEAPVGAADATSPELNALIVNGKPVMWRAGPTAAGRFTIGNQLDSPVVWTDTPNAPALGPAAIPGNGTNGTFSAGAIFPAGGPDPNDLIVLRATTASAGALGSHRLVSIKYDASLNVFDAQWYNVSTLGGSLTEDNSTEVAVHATDEEAHRRFAVALDSNGNLHAVYQNRQARISHYRKGAGFNDSWARLSTDITGAAGGKLALTAATSDDLFLFFESSVSQNNIQSQRFDGATWGAPKTLYNGTDLQKSFGAMERFGSCSPAIAFTEGAVAPFRVMYTLDTNSCAPLQSSEGAGTITVTAPGSFELTFDVLAGGSIEKFYDLAEDPAVDLAGGVNPKGLHNSGIRSGGTNFNTSTDAVTARIHLLETTPTRVRVRQVSSYENNGTGNRLGGVRGVATYSVYPSGRLALNHQRVAEVAVPYETEYSELVVRYTNGVPPLDTWASYYELVGTGSGTGNDDFTLTQSEVASARADFLQIFSKDWVAGPDHLSTATLTSRTFQGAQERVNAYWLAGTGGTIPAGSIDRWDSLTYFKPTGLLDHTDLQVTRRSTDYRSPDSLSVSVGGPWIHASENTGGGDDFNESEAAYALTFDPALGLTFDIDGGTNPRFSPFVKIRQWRSLQDATGVDLEGTGLLNDVDYRSDVKPISRAHFADGSLLLHSTLESGAAVTSPDVGSAGSVNGGASFAPGRYGNGLFVDAAGESVSFPSTQNIDFNQGAVEFWVRPNFNHIDGQRHRFWSYSFDFDNALFFEKHSTDELRFGFRHGPNPADQGTARILPTDYSWKPGDWVHLRAVWDTTQSMTNRLRIFVNGVEPPNLGPGNNYIAANLATGGSILLGTDSGGANPVDGVMDEFRLFGAPDAPTSLALGGLTVNSTEYLASGSRNFTYDFVVVDASRRGKYAYFGADSTFRGLNVALATPGAGTVDLKWEYWNGAAWGDLESGFSFTDQTNHFKASGTIHWTDPAGWAPYSVDGGPDLYYVRAHLASGSYTTDPVEGIIKTDILLFQYCGDITANAMTFSFAVPTPTAVTLQSLEAVGFDGGVELRWRTASELNNVGFHIYRSPSTSGGWTRITSSAIPGLGSSPAGAAYSYRDTGLVNGETYRYELEDIETTGRTKRHGPVSATPKPGAEPSDAPPPEDDPPTARITYGDPNANTFVILEQNRRHVVVELRTGGFYAEPTDDGSVRIVIPGFDEVLGEGAAIPVRREWLPSYQEQALQVDSVQPFDVERFASLRPSKASKAELMSDRRGSVKARNRRSRAAFQEEGLYPEAAARVVMDGYQADDKRALLELAPLRWNARSGELVLAKRLRVRLSYSKSERVARRSASSDKVIARFATRSEGLYAVRFEDVLSERSRGASELRLSRQGDDVAYHLEPNSKHFRPGSTLYFYSEGSDSNPYGDEAVFELELGAPGRGMELIDATPTGEPVDAYWHVERREDNRLYQAGLVEAIDRESDLWLWDVLLAPVAKTYPFAVSELASSGAESARLLVRLVGTTDVFDGVDHDVRLRVNGVPVAEASWDGKRALDVKAEIPPGVLFGGENVFEVENVGTDAAYSMVMLDWFEVRYPRRAIAIEGRLRGAWSKSGVAELHGMGTSVVILELSGDQPKWLQGFRHGSGGVRFEVKAGAEYFASSSAERPEVRRASANSLLSRSNRADWIVIGPRAFLDTAEPLVRLRLRDGLRARAVAVEDIYESFGHGETTPRAINEFLRYAYQHWSKPALRYVLLLGDGTYDFKDYLRTGKQNQIPPLIVKTSYLWTASDPSFALVNGEDPLPDVAIGRLPAASPDEARSMVSKILAYEASGAKLGDRVVLVADNPDRTGDFDAHVRELTSGILSRFEPEPILLSQLGAAETRSRIRASFEEGMSLTSYIGHGGIHLWASENVLETSDVTELGPQSSQPVLVTMNCLNGYFHFPYFDALSEALVKAEDKGAVAAFSPSGLSLDGPAHEFHQVLLTELTSGRAARLGDAVLAAQRNYAQSGALPELLSIYHLLGDPALRIR